MHACFARLSKKRGARLARLPHFAIGKSTNSLSFFFLLFQQCGYPRLLRIIVGYMYLKPIYIG